VKNIGVSTPVARSGVETPFGAVAQKEDSIEFLVEFEVEVPARPRRPLQGPPMHLAADQRDL